MQTATISISQVYPPGAGKTNWAIVGGDGVRYSVPPAFANQLQTGQSVSLEYKVNSFNGKDIRMVEKVSFMNAPAQQPAPQVVQPPRQVAPPPPQQQPHGLRTQSKEMFIMGCVGRAMGSGQFGVTDIYALTLAASQAWDALG